MDGTLDWMEYLGVAASFVVTVLVSYDSYRKRKSVDATNPRGISLTSIILSLIASFTSGVSLLGKPAEAYTYGIEFLFFYLSILIPNVYLLNFVYLPVVEKLSTASIYEYFDCRFDSNVRHLVTFVFIITRILQTSIAAMPPAFVINKFSDLDVNLVIIGLMSVTSFCTMIGGFAGVVRADAVQGVIMLASMAVMCILSVVQVGGLGRVINVSYSTGRLAPSKISLEPTDRVPIWSYLSFIHACSSLLLNQSSYQRMKTLPSIKEMRIAMTSQLLGMFAFALSSAFVGLSIYAFFFGCDPKEAQLVSSSPDVIIYWMNQVGARIHGLRGVYLAGITCASVSTISTHLNTVAQLICKELWKDSDDCTTRVRSVTCLVGFIATMIAIFFKNVDSLVEITFAFISLDGITSGLFILGTLIVPANSKGAFASGIINMTATLLFAVGSRYFNARGSLKPYKSKPMRTDLCPFNVSTPITQPASRTPDTVFYLFRISPFFYAVITVLNTILVGLAISLMTKSDEASELMESSRSKPQF